MDKRTNDYIKNQIRFVCSVEAECEKRNKNLKNQLNDCKNLDQVEYILLGEVKFVGLLLEEIRRSNKIMQEKIGIGYAKLIGLGTPYEEAIHVLRQVKLELDTYLKIIRDKMLSDMKQKFNYRKKKFR